MNVRRSDGSGYVINGQKNIIVLNLKNEKRTMNAPKWEDAARTQKMNQCEPYDLMINEQFANKNARMKNLRGDFEVSLNLV